MDDALRRALGVLSVIYALVFIVAALVHAGITFGLNQPVIVPATIVESLCGIAMIGGAYGGLVRGSWNAIIYAHAFALAGVLLGVLSLGFGAAPATTFVTWYHRTMAALLTLGLAGALYVSRERK